MNRGGEECACVVRPHESEMKRRRELGARREEVRDGGEKQT